MNNNAKSQKRPYILHYGNLGNQASGGFVVRFLIKYSRRILLQFVFKNSALKARGIFVIIVLLISKLSYAIDPPVFSSNNTYVDWVDSTVCKFENSLGRNQRILFTVDGSTPANVVSGSTRLYSSSGIRLGKTCTVRAITTQGNSPKIQISTEESRLFTRKKAPEVFAKYGKSTSFENSLLCTLSVSQSAPPASIRYSRNGVDVNLNSPIYTAPFKIESTEKISFFSDANGYDPSPRIYLQFTKIEKIQMPTIVTEEKKFSTPSLAIAVICPKSAIVCRYTFNDSVDNISTQGTVLSGDTIRVSGVGEIDTLNLRIQGYRIGVSPSPINSRTYIYYAPVAEPTSDSKSRVFYDSLTVRLSSTTPNATIRYTNDLSIPDRYSADASNGMPIKLFHPTTLKAIAFKDPQPPSSQATFEYQMRLSSPWADQPSREYLDSLVVHLTAKNHFAQIYYSLTGTAPKLSGSQIVDGMLYEKSTGILITAPGITVLKAIAVLDGVASEVVSIPYSKKESISVHSQPLISPTGLKFDDSIFIQLSTVDRNAIVRYTLSPSGTPPLATSMEALPNIKIRLDSSAVLASQTFPVEGKSGLNPSPVRYDTFTLIPSPPIYNPSPVNTYISQVQVTLKSQTRGGFIHYTVNDDKSDPANTIGQRDSVIITLTNSAVLRALVRVGSEKSAMRVLQYLVVKATSNDTLALDSSRTFAGGIIFRNNSVSKVIAIPHAIEELGLKGFANLSVALRIKALNPGEEINITYSKPLDLLSALYFIGVNGKPELVSNATTTRLNRVGDYFLARDNSKPSISLLSQKPIFGDSTTVVLQVMDNVAAPICEISSPYIQGGKIVTVPDADGKIEVKLKGPASASKAIWMRVATHDFFNTTFLPADTLNRLFISQTLDLDKTPEVFNIGSGKGWELWDLAGLPVSNAAPISWSDFVALNPGMIGVTWRDTGYAFLEANAMLKPGMAWWLANRKPSTALKLEKLGVGESDSAGRFAITLRPGWNEITSPSIERTYWPVTIALSQSGRSTVKAPYRFNRQWSELYRQTDILEPWVGYYVRYYGFNDTTVFVYSDPGQRAASMPKSAADSRQDYSIDLEFDQAGAVPVRLGARTWAKDEIGAEDEPVLPALKGPTGIAAKRGKSALMSDLIHFNPGMVHHWKLIRQSHQPMGEDARLRIAALPKGYETWAVSPARRIKFQLESDHVLPASFGDDTLSIYAGPAEKLSAIPELAQSTEKIEAFFYALEQGADYTNLRLDLPLASTIDIGVWNLAGRRLTHAQPGLLAMGTYRIRLNGQRDGQPGILRVQLRNNGTNQSYSRRIIW
jgi:Chitobiase/beta-hexosaminidase C-terminal domain